MDEMSKMDIHAPRWILNKMKALAALQKQVEQGMTDEDIASELGYASAHSAKTAIERFRKEIRTWQESGEVPNPRPLSANSGRQRRGYRAKGLERVDMGLTRARKRTKNDEVLAGIDYLQEVVRGRHAAL